MPSSQLSRDEIHRNLDSFQSHWLRELEEWKAKGLTGEEQKSAQRFWIDLFSCFGVSAARMNLFERNARRGDTGNTGRIDLFYPGVVIGEAKKPGVDLEVAYEQVLDYLNGGSIRDFEYPRYILCSNFEQFRLIRLGDTSFDVTFELSEIVDYLDSLKFLAGYDTVTKREEERASIRASQLMAELFTAMAGDDVDEAVGDEAPTNFHDEALRVHETSMYLTRLLFLLFGDDAGLWEADLFTRFVEENTTPENLGPQLNALFEVLNTPGNRRRHVPDSMAAFPYVNGAIFAEPMRTQYFTPAMRTALLHACRFNWSEISPAIFGSLFQLVKSKEARRSDGEHYTSETNILKTLEPLFLTELREKAERLITSRSTTVKALREFRDSLADYAFLDPACGSGNFLIVAYRELRKIETDLIVAIRRKEGTLDDMALDVSFEQKLSIGQFYGIELNWWPARIAETAMFLVDHQANKELAQRIGAAPERLPIRITAHIQHANALAVDWSLVVPEPKGETLVFGNPPFIGQYTKTKEQTEDMKRVWGKDYDGYLDYVTGWHAQAMKLLSQRKGQFAYVTTNSITQGQPVPALFGPLFREGWRIKFAHRTFSWDSEAPGKAAVHCVIVGFSRGEFKPLLWDYPRVNGEAVSVPVATGINAYLVDGPNVLVAKRSKPLADIPKVTYGSKAVDNGNLIVEVEDYEAVSSDSVAAKYLRPFRGSKELVRGLERWCLWLENLDPGDVSSSSVLSERLDAVRRFRDSSKKEATRQLASLPQLFGERRAPTSDYLCIPSVVSETRPYFTAARFSRNVIVSNLAFWAPDEDGLLFSLVSSSMFMAWQKTVGGRLKSDLRFSNTLVWNTFPVPELSDKQREGIVKAGKKVLEARGLHPERSLAEHYAPLSMAPELVKAHEALDRQVDKAFGTSRKLTNERQRLELLFSNYQRLTEVA
ncbi:N-6 DNA methylase [Corynebacterium curieae]|uniref:site-specific DNA-methyltransferase (adenine-specific) n=1 Tax=Corynebacterium curieae TaxID=2913500 RepID=A0ABU3W9N1_9CORY|nr:DNA methyltransferase [Corynebacterium curieae]MDV2424769.1 N-6 DNA methylase [Corynebacterium curieae]